MYMAFLVQVTLTLIRSSCFKISIFISVVTKSHLRLCHLHGALSSLNQYFVTFPSFIRAHYMSLFLVVLDLTFLRVPREEFTVHTVVLLVVLCFLSLATSALLDSKCYLQYFSNINKRSALHQYETKAESETLYF